MLTIASVVPAEHWDAQEWSTQFVLAYNDGTAPFGVINVLTAYGYRTTGNVPADYMACRSCLVQCRVSVQNLCLDVGFLLHRLLH